MKHEERARELFLSGYNCAQAVAGAFAEECGLTLEEAVRATAALGGGVGGMREVCGAVLGMGVALGLKEGSSEPKDRAAKAALYAHMQALSAKFREENGSIVCRELLERAKTAATSMPAERDASYYKKRPCAELVACAARLIEDNIEKSAD